jgi:hypothetical protein
MTIKPQNLPEKLVWLYIVFNIPIHFIGLQFFLAPLLAYFLVGYLVIQWWKQNEDTPSESQVKVSIASWVLIASILIIAVILLIGCLDFELGFGRTLSSLINRWLRTWALFAVFPLVGHLKIRPQIIFRAVCILCIQMLAWCCVSLATTALHISPLSYISPLSFLGGGIGYYTVHVFGVTHDGDGSLRLIMNAPWSPALGLLGNVLFLLCYQERKLALKCLGMIGALVLIAGSFSRTGVICLPIVLLAYFCVERIFKPYFLFTIGGFSFIAAIFSDQMLLLTREFITGVKSFRQGSTDSRDKIQQLALNSLNEAFIWGHGTFAEKGPALIHGLGVGSHHMWYGLLYLHGIVGTLVFAVAIIWSFWSLFIKVGITQYAPLGISLLGILLIFSFSENIDSLLYLCWPGLVILGTAFNETESFDKNQFNFCYSVIKN